MDAVKRVARDDFHVIGQAFAGSGGEFLEDERDGDDGRPGVVGEAPVAINIGAAPGASRISRRVTA